MCISRLRVCRLLLVTVNVSRLLQRQKDLNNVNDMLGALHKSVARASALPDYKEKKAEYVRGPRVLCRLVCSPDIPAACPRVQTTHTGTLEQATSVADS